MVVSISDTILFYDENVNVIHKIKGGKFVAIHSQIRAEQRYGLCEFNPIMVMKEILDDRCILVEENIEKFSRIFYVRYNNKYLKVVTDYNVLFVKTVLPDATDFNIIEKLIYKLANVSVLAV